MDISLNLNQQVSQFSISPGDSLLTVLRNNGIFSPKSGGCRQGECGACTILFDGKPINSCQILALQAVGHNIETIEQFGENPEKGWMKNKGFNILQKTFMETGAIQCGYCTPGMILAAEALLRNNNNPTETEIRESLSGVLCRCTGYLKPVEAVIQAAAILRGEKIEKIQFQPTHDEYMVVGRPEQKVDATKLAQGKPAFALDIEKRDVLVAKILHSPIAHA
jgi:putative selenate reductase molybdopterin-binding subunit